MIESVVEEDIPVSVATLVLEGSVVDMVSLLAVVVEDDSVSVITEVLDPTAELVVLVESVVVEVFPPVDVVNSPVVDVLLSIVVVVGLSVVVVTAVEVIVLIGRAASPNDAPRTSAPTRRLTRPLKATMMSNEQD